MVSDEFKTFVKYGVLIVGIVAELVFIFVTEQNKPKVKTDVELWQEYAKANQCKVIERHDGYSDDTSGVGVTARGSGVMIGSTYHSAQDLWQCVDGVKHHKAARFAEALIKQP